MKPLYKDFIKATEVLLPDKEISKHIDELILSNLKLYKRKRALVETGFHSPATIGMWTIIYLIGAFIVLLLPAFFFLISDKISGLLFWGIFLIYITGVLITRAAAAKSKFTHSPLVNKSLYHKMFVGGTDTKWYKFKAELAHGVAVDEIENGDIAPVNIYYIVFVWGEENSVCMMEISKEECSLLTEYDFDTSAVGICGKDIVGVYLYKEGEEWYEALPKIPEE